MGAVTVLTFVRAHWRLVLGACLVVAAFCVGYAAHRPATITRTETIQGAERVVEKTVTVEKPVEKWRDRTVVVERLTPAGQVQERTTTHDTSGSRSEGSETTVKVKDDLHIKSSETVKTTNLPRLHAYAEVGPTLSLASGHIDVAATAGVTYQILGPVYVGGVVVEPSLTKPVAPIVSVVLGIGL